MASPSLLLRPFPVEAVRILPVDIFTRGTPLVIPLGAGMYTGILERSGPGYRSLTTDDLVSRDMTVGALWADAALSMLAALGQLTTDYGTALRQRPLCHGVREIGILDEMFPAAGLVAHPLLLRPTVRILRETPWVSVTAGGRLLSLSPSGRPPDVRELCSLAGGEECSAVLRLTGHASDGLQRLQPESALQ